MQTAHEQSFGVIPVHKNENGWRFLLVHQISYRGEEHRFWAFPKGHADAGETALETARRELTEETGLLDVQINEEVSFAVNYQFRHEGATIDKTVTYFLGICERMDTEVTRPREITDIGWFSVKEAMERLTHKKSQEILMQAAQYLNDTYDT